MKPKPINRRELGRGGMELVEEAIHLLRMNAASLPAYYIGSLPFILGLLYFWADMSRSPYAAQHLTGTALGMALLFLWMKFWQALFVNGLRSRLSVKPPTRWNTRRCLRVFLIQTAIQPSAVILLLLAVLPAALPLPWVYAFYQNVTALTEGETVEVRKVFKRALQQSILWPGQNHVVLAILTGFGGCVLINIASAFFVLPQLLKMLLGIDSVYTQSPTSMFNTTFFAAVFSLTYLCVDPIIKTVYLLRCFYGESLQSGEDLKAELKKFVPSAKAALAGFLLILCLSCATSSSAADIVPPNAATPASTISPSTLDKAINEVIRQPKYTWRMPREKVVAADETRGAMGRFIENVLKTTGRWIRAVWRWFLDIWDKLFGGKRAIPHEPGGSGANWIVPLQTLFFVLLVVLVCTLVIFIYRAWKRSYRLPPPVASEALFPLPDLTDENVGADQLPEDGWIKLGRELLGRGELRLALRAFYFASLAHLATRNLITIAKFKSNRDYESELRRRGHSLPDMQSLFGENVQVFDRIWYGLHEVNPAMVGRFLANVERIKTV